MSSNGHHIINVIRGGRTANQGVRVPNVGGYVATIRQAVLDGTIDLQDGDIVTVRFDEIGAKTIRIFRITVESIIAVDGEVVI